MTLRAGVAALAVAVLAGCASGPAAVPPPAGPPVSAVRLGLSEYRIQTSAAALLGGPVEVTVTNAGSAQHDVRLEQAGRTVGASRVLPPGGRQVLRLVVAAGIPVRLVCTLPGHATAGMTGSMTVSG